MSYFQTYVLGYRSDSGKKAESGTMVHKVMEILAGLKKFQQDNPTRKFLEIEDDAVGKVKAHRDKLFDNDYINELCDISFNHYKSESKHKWGKADQKEVKKLSFDILNFNDGQFDPRYRNIVETEPHFDIPIEEDWAKYEYDMPDGTKLQGQLAIKGTIDLVTQFDKGIIEVIDWKTGQRKDWATGEEKDFKKLKTDPQLLLYHYAISKLYPQYKQAIMTIFFVRDKGPFSMCFDESDKKLFLNNLRDRFEEIKANNNPKPLREDRSHWKCQRLCHFYKNNFPGTDTPMCIHVGKHLKEHGMEKTVVELTAPNFSIGHYEAPG